ncbi:MAG: NUDIX domain-containing protein [Candidatus Micrarchaeia archaeon]
MAGSNEKIRKGITAIVFRLKGKKPEFLLLHRIKRWNGWEMLKGGRIGRERPMHNLMRELREEIYADQKRLGTIIPLPFKLKFKTPKDYVKKYKYTRMEFQSFLVEYNGPVSIKVNAVLEHDEYRWVSYNEALRLLTHDTNKKLLKNAYNFLKRKINYK